MADVQLNRTWDGLHIASDQPTGASVVVRRRTPAGQLELLLLHRNGEGAQYEGDWAWTSPAGCRQPGEAVYPAALRELAEEAGLVGLQPWAVDLSWPESGDSSWVVFALDVPSDVHVDLVDPEHDRYAWVSPAEARRRVLPAFVATGQVDGSQHIPMVELSFRRMLPEDLPNVVEWRRSPHAVKWWHGGVSTLLEAQQHYGPRINGDVPTRMWVVSMAGRDVGYLQDYLVGDHDEYAVATGEPDAVAFDFLIGDPEMTGRGLGTRMIWEFLRDVLAPGYPDVATFLASPDRGNAASLRALAKCGFSQTREIDLPAGDTGGPVREVVCTFDRRHWLG